MDGHIHKRQRTTTSGQVRTRWYVIVDIGPGADGRRRQKWHGGYPTRRAAESARIEILYDLHHRRATTPLDVTFRHWIEATWLPAMRSQVKPSTWDSYSRMVDLHALPRIGDALLRDITPPMLNDLYRGLLEVGRRNGSGGLSAKTVRNLHIAIHKSLADAVDDGLLTDNPADRARPPKPTRVGGAQLRFWTAEQLATFLRSVDGTRLETAWHLAAMTGMRRGEVLGLRWADIDLARRCLAVRNTIISVAYQTQVSTPKNHQARVIDLDQRTCEQLRRHRHRQADERHRLGGAYEDHDLVFCRDNGAPLQPDNFTQTFERAIARTDLPRVRLHDLRHTHATIALRAGVPTKVVSERLGHQSPAFTLSQYAHSIPGMQAEAADKIADLVLGSLSGDTPIAS